MLEAPILRWFAFPHQQILLYQSGTAKIGVEFNDPVDLTDF